MADLKESRVPDIGDFKDIPVIEVLVAVGDRVTKDQGIATLESDKATMEVPAEHAGVVKELKIKLGDKVSQGSLVAVIDAEGEGGGESDGAPAPPRAEPVAAQAAAAETDTAVQPVAVESRPDNIAAMSMQAEGIDVPGAPGGPELAQAKPPVNSHGAGLPPVRFAADAVLPEKVPYASPAVRLYARELGVELMRVTGSGNKGRITREDVQCFVRQAISGTGTSAVPAGQGGGLDLLPWPKVDFTKFGEVERKPLSRIQKISGANLARNWAMIPHVTQFDRADITTLEDLRNTLNDENAKAIAAGKAGKVTMLAFLIKACVAALRKFPTFNASLDGDDLVLKQYFHIGFAADTPNGLVVPVLRDADKKGVMHIAQEMGELASLAREGKLKPDQMQGGSFTISSLGGIGGTAFTPIINAPEVAILGVSKSEMAPVWNGERFDARLMLPLSLSYDHRVIDGALAARFTSYLTQILGDMRRAML